MIGLEEFRALGALAPKVERRTSTRSGAAPSGAGDYTTLDVVAWFSAHGHYGKPRADGKHAVLCPWADEHSDDQGAESPDTVVWPADGGWPTFHCSHAHCVGRTLQTVMDLWGDADRFCSGTFERSESWPVTINAAPAAAPVFDDAPVAVPLPPAFPEVGGPPTKIGEGHQEAALRSAAAGFRRAGMTESVIYSALITMNAEQCDPPLPIEIVQQIASDVSQFEPSEAQDWRVSAASGTFTGLDPLRKIGTDPPRYEAMVRGEPIELSAKELMGWIPFKFACMTRLNYLPELPDPDHPKDKAQDQTRWEREFVAPAIERMKKRGQFEDAPEDAGERGAAWEDVLAFFRKKRLGEEKDDVADDRLVLLDGFFYFRGRALRQWLADNKLDRLDPGDLWDVVRKHGGKPCNLRVKQSASCPKGQCACWKVPNPLADRASDDDES